MLDPVIEHRQWIILKYGNVAKHYHNRWQTFSEQSPLNDFNVGFATVFLGEGSRSSTPAFPLEHHWAMEASKTKQGRR